MDKNSELQKPFYKKGWFIATAVIVVLLIIGRLKNDDSSQKEKQTAQTNDATEKNEVEKKTTLTSEKPKEIWNYLESSDQMTGEKSFFASTNSTNQLKFDFPYNGGSDFVLTVQKTKSGSEVYLKVSKGQFMSSYNGSEYCRVKFDDGETTNFKYVGPSDYSSDILFFQNVKGFLKKLKTAEKLMIEAPFYDEGRQIIYFDVKGLLWEH